MSEPSHFRNPAANSTTKVKHISDVVARMRSILDDRDAHLITAAVNEIRSGGSIRAIFSDDALNTPGIEFDTVVTPQHLEISNMGGISFRSHYRQIQVIPDIHEIPNRWTKHPVILQHSKDIILRANLVTEAGHPVNISSLGESLRSLSRTPKDCKRLRRRLKQLQASLQIKCSSCGNMTDLLNDKQFVTQSFESVAEISGWQKVQGDSWICPECRQQNGAIILVSFIV